MGFKDHKVKSEYRSLIDNVVQDFYIPLLRESVSYKRAVGFFSSSSLVEIKQTTIKREIRRIFKWHLTSMFTSCRI